MQNAQNRHVPFAFHMEQTVMSILTRAKLHSPRPGILAAITFQQHGTTKNDHRSCKCHFSKQKATPALHNSDSLTTLRAIFQCACPLRPQHTHIKQTWRSELVKVKALKHKSSCTTGVNLLLSSYTSTNLEKLIVHSYSSTAVPTENCLQYYKCMQYFHYRTYFSITAVCNTTIIDWRHLETKTNTTGSKGKEWEIYIMRSIQFEFFTKHYDEESERRNETINDTLMAQRHIQ